ncbi:MAG: hydroxyethylthiazole kinase [Betaproteobacteria bacterium]|nr:hydroxyethylthiazole kinase [Betaproteobacteria bacterium]MBK7592115.1 hydroxyethylthiazole kinase [Betaproteobacteria bacterium]MBK9674278.1 hydroxyethylthiazole kinase [Betaproteobacteria bacterium]
MNLRPASERNDGATLNLGAAGIAEDLHAVRQRAPLVHNITNFVVMQQTANALLALGASPIMAHAEAELDELLALAGALVLNIGTLDAHWISAMEHALAAARQRALPVVLDPVGAGASRLRTDTALALLRGGGITVLRANASEVLALAGSAGGTKGVDSTHSSDTARDAARALATRYGCSVVVSGVVDYCIDARRELRVHNGVAMMARVTGMGCTASALCGAFCAVQPDALRAAVGAMAVMGIAGEVAMASNRGPGTLPAHFLDALDQIDRGELDRRLRLDVSA